MLEENFVMGANTLSNTRLVIRPSAHARTRVAAAGMGSQAPAQQRGPFARLFHREAPTTFHRFLAVHMHFAQPSSALD
jgi:hypothetical protein